jgi:hypothetical protein
MKSLRSAEGSWKMLKIVVPAAVLSIAMLGLYSTQSLADSTCASGKRLSVTQMEELVGSKYVCLRTANGQIYSNEEHRGGPSSPTGELWDYKLGPADRIDPTARVGSYQISERGNNGAQITYTYGSGSRSYQIVPDSGPYYLFCGVGGESDMRMKVQATPGC